MLNELPRSLDPETKALPDERFKDAAETRDFASMLIRADDPRARDRAKTQGLIDGNRPVPQGLLNAQQQGWRANVNYREGEGQVSAQRTPYYDLAMENDPCLEVEIDYGRDQQQAEWERIVARHAHSLIHESDDYDSGWHLQLQQSEMVVHGWGSHLFLSKVDWRPATWTMRHVLFPDRTTSCLDDALEVFVVREPLKAHQANRHIRNEKAAREIGWNPAAVKQSIVDARTTAPLRKTAEDYQSMLKNNDLGFGFNRSRDIWWDHVFVREFEGGRKDRGGISHYIIEENGDGEEYIFSKRNRFDEWQNLITVFPYDIGTDGTIHSIRGLGVRIFPFIELSNRLKNHMVDSVLVGSGVLLTSKGAVDLTKLALTSIGPMKLLPSGVEPANYKAMDLSQGPIALSQELKATSDENNKVYRQSGAQRNYAQTAREVDQTASEASRMQKSAHDMYYKRMDRLYREQVRRACNPNYTTDMPGGESAVAFQRRCLRDGVPKEALAKIVSVKAVRALGAGSAMQRILVARELMTTLLPGADEVSRFNLKRDYVSALANSRAADRYVPSINEAMAPDNDDSVAVLENDALIQGGEALVNTRQNHFKHAMRHAQKADQLLAALAKGADPQQVMNAWDALGPHIAAHLAYLGQDPTRKTQFVPLEQHFNRLSKLADKLAQHLQEQAQAAQEQAANQPQQPPVGPYGIPELDLEWAKMKGQLDIKAQKAQADIALKAQKQQGEAALKDASIAADIRRKARSNGNGVALPA